MAEFYKNAMDGNVSPTALTNGQASIIANAAEEFEKLNQKGEKHGESGR